MFHSSRYPIRFSLQKMVGDGVSIDPTSSDLVAPVAGTVTLLHRAKHALTITTEQGLDDLKPGRGRLYAISAFTVAVARWVVPRGPAPLLGPSPPAR